MTGRLPPPEVFAAERDIATNVVRWVRDGQPVCGLTAGQRRAARRLLADVGEFWRCVRDERRYLDYGFPTFEEGVRARWGVSVADADAVIRAAGKARRRRHG